MNITTAVLHVLRRDHCPPPRYAFASEVKVESDTGKRFIDAVSIDSWNKPHEIVGFEIKVSRSDWQTEQRQPAKSLPARAAVDRFYYVFGSPDIYDAKEVPSDCGIIHVNEDEEAVVIRTAPRSIDADDYAAYPRSFLAGFLRRLVDQEDLEEFVSRIQREAEKKGFERGRNAAKRASPVTRDGRLKYDPARVSVPEPEEVDDEGNWCP